MSRWEVVALIAILVVAIALRVWRLGDVPPGLTHDEASNGHDAAAVLRGFRPIYFTVGYGHEPLYPYSVALLMALLGPTTIALRLTTVTWGLIVLLLSYAFTRYVFGSLAAVLTIAWMALSFWCVMTSRVGLRAITSTAIFAASVYSFWRGFPRLDASLPDASGHKWFWWSLSGVFLGVSIYTYMASRAMPAVYLLFLAYLYVLKLIKQDEGQGENLSRAESRSGKHTVVFAAAPDARWASVFREHWRGILVLLLIAAIVAAPLLGYLITHPDAEQRIDQLSAPLKQALHGDFRGLWSRLIRSLPMFTFRGDPLWLYNIPGRPLLDVAGGAFFYAGLIVAVLRWRDPRYAFLMLWLLVGVGPALVTGPDATMLRSIVAQPAVFITASLGLATVTHFLYRYLGRRGRAVTVGAVVILLLITGVRTAQAYFNVWAQHRDVRVAYHHALVEQAHYLDTQPGDGIVSLSSIYPGRFHDPYTMEVSLERENISLRWFDGRFALVFPSAGAGRMIIPSIAPLDKTLKPLLKPYASLVHTERFRPDDLVTHFDVYRVDTDSALAALLPSVKDSPVFWSPSDTFPVDDPQSVYKTLHLPINVDGVVDLVGYDLRTPIVRPGGDVELLTVWRVRDRLPREAVAFTHVLHQEGRVVGQMDRLDVPSWHWEPGDVFVQLHRFSIQDDTQPGLYPVEVGLYLRENSRRIPIMVEGVPVDDRILLRPLEVTGQ
jgi:hypothetical protein